MVSWSWPWTTRNGPIAVTTRSTSQSLSTFVCLALALSTSVFAQDSSDTTILPSAASASFPSCALTCAALKNAQDACIPPTAQVSTRATYVSCFCQSNFLVNFHSTAEGTCDDTCTVDSDRQLAQKWFTDFCNSGGTLNADSSDTSDTTDTSNTSDQNSGNTNNNGDNTDTNAASTTTAPAATKTPEPAPQTWWDGHYKWVIMIIVLAVGFTAIAFLGIWLKRRHDAKYPNLYHGASGASDSRVFSRSNLDASPVPGATQTLAPGRRYESANTMSIASSSRTDVIVPKIRPEPGTSSLRSPPEDEMEIREVPR